MRKKTRGEFARGVVDKAAFVYAAVVRFVMLESEVRDMIAKRVEEVIVAIVMRAKKFLSLIDEALVVVPDFLRGVEGSGAVGGNVHFGGRILCERDDFQEF